MNNIIVLQDIIVLIQEHVAWLDEPENSDVSIQGGTKYLPVWINQPEIRSWISWVQQNVQGGVVLISMTTSAMSPQDDCNYSMLQ